MLIILFGLIYLFRGDLGLRPTRGYIENKLGGLEETAHFKIYYEKGSKVEKEIEWIAQDHEFRYAQLVQLFSDRTHQEGSILCLHFTCTEEATHGGARHIS